MAYVVPQALIFQEFSILPTALTDPLRACIIGPHYALNRYSDASEKTNILVTSSYDPDNDQAYSWPNRTAGSSVDTTYTKVYIDDALLQYYDDPGGDASVISAVDGYRNRIRFASLVLKTANGYTRTAVFCDRDVATGDVLNITASACDGPVSLQTQILGFVPDVVAAEIDPAEADISNKNSQVEDADALQTAGSANNICVEAIDMTTFDGRADGIIDETYTISVTGGGVGGDATTATLNVVATSGLEGPFTVTPSDFGVATTIGTLGLTVTFNNDGCGSSSSPGTGIDPDDFIVGQTWVVTAEQTFDSPAATSGVLYLGKKDTTYIVEVTTGGDVGTARISATTTTGVDQSGAAIITALGTPIAIGSQGLTITFSSALEGFCKGDKFTIDVVAASDGAVRTVELSTPLPYEMRGICNDGTSSSSSESPPDLATTFYIQKDIQVTANRTGFAPLVNWTQSATQITIESGIVAYDSTWTCSGVLEELDVVDGKVYVEHRDLLPELCGEVNSLTNVSQIDSTAFGSGAVIDPDNPLVFGVYKALSNSSGTAVKFIAVCAAGTSGAIALTDWADALEVLQNHKDVYSLAPMTQLQTVLQLVQAHIEAMSSSTQGRWRIGWFNEAAVIELGEYVCSEALGAGTCDAVLATITDDPATTGTQYTLLTATGQKFLTSLTQEIEAGDIVRTQYVDDGFGNTTYSEYVVDAVLNEEEIRLFTGPSAAINTPSKIEIWRTLSRTEIATDFALNAGTYSSRRVYLVWPDQVGNSGETFAGYYLCAGLAGLRSASLPQRPLTNVQLNGFDDLSRTTEFFNEPQLDILATAGIWIVTQDPQDGEVYTRHQLSTDNLDLNRSEQSVTTNVDSISFALLDRVAVYIGRGNVTDTMINIIRGEILSVLDYFSSFVVQDILGPQIISYEIVSLEQHPTLKDRLVAIINLVVPYPLNNAEIHLVI